MKKYTKTKKKDTTKTNKSKLTVNLIWKQKNKTKVKQNQLQKKYDKAWDDNMGRKLWMTENLLKPKSCDCDQRILLVLFKLQCSITTIIFLCVERVWSAIMTMPISEHHADWVPSTESWVRSTLMLSGLLSAKDCWWWLWEQLFPIEWHQVYFLNIRKLCPLHNSF